MPEPDWVEVRVILPPDEGRSLLAHLRVAHGFAQRDEDWCVEKRSQDNATVDYAPAPPPPDRKQGW